MESKLLLYRTMILFLAQKCELLAATKRRIFQRIFDSLKEDGRFRNLYKNETYQRCHDRLVVDKIYLNMLRSTGHLICMGEVDPVRKICKDSIYGKKGNLADLHWDGAMAYAKTPPSL